jgi:hypothetical protein
VTRADEGAPLALAIEPIRHALLWSAARIRDPGITWLHSRLGPLVKRRFANVVEQPARQIRP